MISAGSEYLRAPRASNLVHGRPNIVSWTLAKVPCETYQRNSLAAVIVQLRIHPVLKIKTGTGIPDFQERIRARFPGYDTVNIQEMEITPAGVQVRQDNAHRFHADGEPTTLTLDTQTVTLEYKAHKSREHLLKDLALMMAALEAAYAPIIPVRLGVRYVNLIKRTVISKDLGRTVEWHELLTAGFATVPGGIAKLDDTTTFTVEMSSPYTRGKMAVRYGVLFAPQPPKANSEQMFRLDTDRFIEAPFKSSEVTALAKEFVEDIFHVFATAAGPALKEWMEPGAKK